MENILDYDYQRWAPAACSQQLDAGQGSCVCSVMHYPRTTDGKTVMSASKAPIAANNAAMGNRRAPSDLDVAKISLLYQCAGLTPPPSHSLLRPEMKGKAALQPSSRPPARSSTRTGSS